MRSARQAPRRRSATLVASLLLLLTLPACAQAAEQTAQQTREQRSNDDAIALELAALLNAARAEHRLVPLRFHPGLTRFAQRRARETAAAGNLQSAGRRHLDSLERLRAEGYDPQFVSEVYAQVSGTPEEVIAGWRGQGDETWTEVLRSAWRDVGIGIATLDGQPLYALVFAQPRSEFFAIETSDLSDLKSVRDQMLAAVNAARKQSRQPPLRLSPILNRAAQRYAELMLESGHYGHEGPRGESSLDRAVDQGYVPVMVGENLARGQMDLDDVMEGWLESPGHRRNILGNEYEDAGFGVALGRGPGGFDVYWVQLFGKER